MSNDRDRIAHDLHLRVVSRLDAIRLLAELAAGEKPISNDAADLLAEVLQTVDRTQADIRDAVLEWRSGDSSLVSELRGVIDDYAPLMRRAPELEAFGSVDDVPQMVAANLSPVLREALSNVARHAAALNVRVELRVTDTEVQLSVDDDGVGPSTTIVENGLRQLRRRAEALGGSAELRPGQVRGSTFVWRVPLD